MKYADRGSMANQLLPLFVLTEIQGTHQVFKLLKQKYDLFSYYVSNENVFVNHSDLVITLSDTQLSILQTAEPDPFRLTAVRFPRRTGRSMC